jgi:hypothetical protein
LDSILYFPHSEKSGLTFDMKFVNLMNRFSNSPFGGNIFSNWKQI